jgi:sugar transferase (PEP-CTERM/EpsH1 system associated)
MRHFADHHTVYLASLIDDPVDLQYREVVAGQVHGSHLAFQSKPRSWVNALFGLLRGRPLSFAFFWNGELAAWVKAVLRDVKPDVIFVCSSNMAPYVIDCDPKIRKVVDFADVDSVKWQSYTDRARGLWRWVYRRENQKVVTQEQLISAWAEASTFVTQEEADLFKTVVPEAAAKTFAMPSGVDSDYFSPTFEGPNLLQGPGPHFVFTGTMDYLPNIDAVTWFSTEVLPRIRAVHPAAMFYIVGSKPSTAVQQLAKDPGIIVTHRVPDVRPYLQHCTAAVAPLRIARGIQNKVLEAMAMGCACVVTQDALVGIEAVPETHLLRADAAEDFAQACLKLTADRASAKRFGQASRQLIEQNYSWAGRLVAFDALLRHNPKPTGSS